MSSDKFLISEWETEKLAELVEATKEENARKDLEKLEEARKDLEKLEEARKKLEQEQENLEQEQEKLEQERKKIVQERKKIVQEHEKGIQQGMQLGREEGIEQNKIEIATNMLNKKYEIKEISEVTGLNEEEIIKIKKSL